GGGHAPPGHRRVRPPGGRGPGVGAGRLRGGGPDRRRGPHRGEPAAERCRLLVGHADVVAADIRPSVRRLRRLGGGGGRRLIASGRGWLPGPAVASVDAAEGGGGPGRCGKKESWPFA